MKKLLFTLMLAATVFCGCDNTRITNTAYSTSTVTIVENHGSVLVIRDSLTGFEYLGLWTGTGVGLTRLEGRKAVETKLHVEEGK